VQAGWAGETNSHPLAGGTRAQHFAVELRDSRRAPRTSSHTRCCGHASRRGQRRAVAGVDVHISLLTSLVRACFACSARDLALWTCDSAVARLLSFLSFFLSRSLLC
jgi:hypothetical protein